MTSGARIPRQWPWLRIQPSMTMRAVVWPTAMFS